MKFYLLLLTTFFFTLYSGYSKPLKCEPLLADVHNEKLTQLQKETCDNLNAHGTMLYLQGMLIEKSEI